MTRRMRVIAGSLGGRSFDSPRSHRTHPMSDKVRGALFNALGDITGLTVLDGFAGSGALSYEAISRGALRVVAVDIDSQAYQTIQANAIVLGITDKIAAIRANIRSWADQNPEATFDVVLADPPYDSIGVSQVQDLVRHVAVNGILVVSWPGGEQLPTLSGLELVSVKSYGDAQLGFYKQQDQ